MTGVDQNDCGNLSDLLDIYLDNELPAAEMTLIGNHLAQCERCRKEFDERIAFRERLRKAVRSSPVPSKVSGADFVNSAITRRPVYRNPAWMAVAAALILALGVTAYQLAYVRSSVAHQDSYIAKISGETAPVIRIGLKDHVHCAVFRKYPAVPPSADEMAAKLGPEYVDLIPALQSNVPSGINVAMAHKCRYRGRQYVHLVARGAGHLISLVIAKRSEGEAFESDLKAVVAGSEGSLYSAGVREFSIAGFETPQHLVYLISDTDQTRNLTMLRAMTVKVRQVLGKVES